MNAKKRKSTPLGQTVRKGGITPVYLVSGASGASGRQIVETVLAQFPGMQVPIIEMPHVRRKEQVKDIVAKASIAEGTIVHTLVNTELRKTLVCLGEKQNVVTIDLMGPLLDRLEDVSGIPPKGKPGLYRKLRREYFDRIAAIEFTTSHDDGQRPQDLGAADIVLLGVSRSGKTPLSMYLAVHGWKVANVPLVMEVPLPQELSRINRRRVIGLSISYEHLMFHRKKRQEGMGISAPLKYADRSIVLQELEAARKIYRKGGFHVVTVTDKPIESIAEEIIEYLTMTFKKNPRKAR